MNRPILQLPDMTKDFILQTDPSDQAVGTVLLQECCDELFPVAFASKKFTEREKRYSTMEKECLALVWAVKKFQVYLYGRTFTLQTDHQPLVYLDKCKVENARMMSVNGHRKQQQSYTENQQHCFFFLSLLMLV